MKYAAGLVGAIGFIAAAAQAAPQPQGNAAMLNQAYVTGYVGIFDVLKTEQDAVQVGGEYRFAQWDFGVRPTVGINADFNGGGYLYGGLNWEVPLGNSPFSLIPNFMVGLYRQGESKQLGGPIEFRSGIELDYQLPNTQRIGLAFNHISNASIYDHNPGAETLMLNYSVPVSVFGR